MKSDLMDVAVEKKAESAAAWLLSDGDKEGWFPKSQCELVRKQDGSYELTAPTWLLTEKEFI